MFMWVPDGWREGKVPERKHRWGLTGRELLGGTGGNKCNFTPLGVQEEESHDHPSLLTPPSHGTPAQGKRAASASRTLAS